MTLVHKFVVHKFVYLKKKHIFAKDTSQYENDDNA